MAKLSQSEIEEYRSQGFLVLKNKIDPEALETARKLIVELVNKFARDYLRDGKISSLYEDETFERRLAKINEEHEIETRNWRLIAELGTPESFRLVVHPEILDIIELLIGPEIAWTSSYSVRPKLPKHELTAFPWHQDSQYYGEKTRHIHVVSVWIPPVDVDERNGCLYVIPKSHTWGLLKGARGEDRNVRTFEDVEKRGEEVLLPMKKGDILLFSNLLFHTSKYNTTNTVRWSVDLRYVAPPDSRELTDQEREGYETLTKSHGGMAPITVRSTVAENIASLEQLRDYVAGRH